MRADTPPSPTIDAATGIARSARVRPRVSGLRSGWPNSCPCLTSKLSSRGRRLSQISPTRPRRRSTLSRSRPLPRRCRTIAAGPKHLGARIGITAVLQTWGLAIARHPHVHMIVPGDGCTADGTQWVGCRPNFFLPVFVLSRLFHRLMFTKLSAAHSEGMLTFFGKQACQVSHDAFASHLAHLRKTRWFSIATKTAIPRTACSAALAGCVRSALGRRETNDSQISRVPHRQNCRLCRRPKPLIVRRKCRVTRNYSSGSMLSRTARKCSRMRSSASAASRRCSASTMA